MTNKKGIVDVPINISFTMIIIIVVLAFFLVVYLGMKNGSLQNFLKALGMLRIFS